MSHEQNISELEQQLRETENLHQKIDIMNQLAFRLFNYDLERSTALCRQSIELSKKSGMGEPVYLKGLVWGYVYLSNVHLLTGNFDKALKIAGEAFPLVENNEQFGQAYTHLLIVYSASLGRIADISGALKNLFTAADLAEKGGHTDLLSWALDSIATIYADSGDNRKSLEFYFKAVDIKKDDKEWTAFIYNNIAESYLGLQDYDSALKYALECLKITEDCRILRLKPHILEILGEIYCGMKDYGSSLEYLDRARGIAKEMDIEYLLMSIDLHIGQTCSLRGDSDADLLFYKALAQAEKLGTLREQYLCHEGLYLFYKEAGNPGKALEHHEAFQELNLKFYNENHNDAVRLLNVYHETEKLRDRLKEREIRIREIHHRVKNNLNMVSSLLKLKAVDLDMAGCFDETVNQINAIGLVHDKLYRGEITSDVNIRVYLTELVDTIFSSFSAYDVSVGLHIDDLDISGDKVSVIGLIVNEAAVNALKHGFRQEQECRFQVDFHRDETYRLTIRNSLAVQGASTSEDRDGSLGMPLINALVKQLRGEVRITADTDYSLEIVFP